MPGNWASAYDRPRPTYASFRVLLRCGCCITLGNGLEPRLGAKNAITCLAHGRRYRVVTWQRV
jgi:hypothetical protein